MRPSPTGSGSTTSESSTTTSVLELTKSVLELPPDADVERTAVPRNGVLQVLLGRWIRVVHIEQIPHRAEQLEGAAQRLDDREVRGHRAGDLIAPHGTAAADTE